MTVNQRILEAQIKHSIFLERYKGGVLKQIIGLLNSTEEDLIILIASRLTAIEGRGFDLSASETKRLEKLLQDIRKKRESVYKILDDRFSDEMDDFSQYEADFQIRLAETAGVQAAFEMPSNAQLKAIVTSQPFRGRLLKDWTKGLEQEEFKRLNDAIRIGITEGQTTDQIVRRIRGTKAARYQNGILEISRRDAATITNTAVAHVANRARAEVYLANADIVHKVQYVATLDSSTTILCGSRDGNVYVLGTEPNLPAHFNCLPHDAIVLARSGITGASKRWFDGNMVTFKTASGRELTCTPNHPILTDRGWIAAQSLDLADNVVCDGVIEWPTATDGDGKNVPAFIHDVTKAFFSSSKVRTMPMPVTAEDFHGDTVNGEIAIVGTYCHLWRKGHTPFCKHFSKLNLIKRAAGIVSLMTLSNLHLFGKSKFYTSNRIMCGLGKMGNLFRAGIIHSGLLLLRPISGFYSILSKYSFNYTSRGIKYLSNAAKTYPLIEKFNQFVNGKFKTSASCLNPSNFKKSINISALDTQLASNITNGATGKVFLDSVISIESRTWAGHVYNLETTEGFYVANGIITHNCRSIYIAYFDVDEVGDRASQFGPIPASTKFSDFLKKQSDEFQEEVLGVERAKQFRAGTPLTKFVDNTGRTYTLKELKARET